MSDLDVIDKLGIKLDSLRAIADWMEGAENRDALGIRENPESATRFGVLLSSTIDDIEQLLGELPFQHKPPAGEPSCPESRPPLTVV